MKRRILLLVAWIACALLAPRGGVAQQQAAAPPEMERYYLILLRKGPAWKPGTSPELSELQKKHLAHLQSLDNKGHGALGGPVEDHADGTLRGILILRAASLEEAVVLESADPAVQAGRLRIEAHVLWVEKGVLPAPKGAER